MEYTVVVRMSVTALVEEVNQLINDGWVPYGSLAVVTNPAIDEYLQPMTRHVGYTVNIEPADYSTKTPITP